MGSDSVSNLNTFFEKVKSVGLFERIFSWKKIKLLSYEAYGEYKSFDNILESKNQEIKKLTSDFQAMKELKEYLDQNNRKLELEKQQLKEANSALSTEKITLTATLDQYKGTEEQRTQDFDNKVASLNTLYQQLEQQIQKTQQEREEEVTQRFEELKRTWVNHEQEVEEHIRGVCKHCQVEFVDKESVPFKGKPDNTIKICDEYVIFDAKSPQSDDLNNFPSYIRLQTESVKKYIKEQGVKKDIFLVVPTSTINVIPQYYYNMADYNVFIITVDSLLPIIMSLRKVEDYEFAEQLSPEDRDAICRIIGRFTHAAKRRMQIDSYFCNETMELLANCNELPTDIYEQALDYEKSDKLNPPIEKRAKAISETELKKSARIIKQGIDGNDIDISSLKEQVEKINLTKSN